MRVHPARRNEHRDRPHRRAAALPARTVSVSFTNRARRRPRPASSCSSGGSGRAHYTLAAIRANKVGLTTIADIVVAAQPDGDRPAYATVRLTPATTLSPARSAARRISAASSPASSTSADACAPLRPGPAAGTGLQAAASPGQLRPASRRSVIRALARTRKKGTTEMFDRLAVHRPRRSGISAPHAPLHDRHRRSDPGLAHRRARQYPPRRAATIAASSPARTRRARSTSLRPTTRRSAPVRRLTLAGPAQRRHRLRRSGRAATQCAGFRRRRNRLVLPAAVRRLHEARTVNASIRQSCYATLDDPHTRPPVPLPRPYH